MGCLDKIGPGRDVPNIVNVIIEIPMNSSVKYELDKEACLPKVDRFLYTSMVYPFNYGLIPGTMEEDGDPVDVLVISREPILPGSIIEVTPIGLLEMEDEEGPDSKVIAVPKAKLDPYYAGWRDVNDIPDSLKSRIKHFFEHYKELEPGKWVRVTGWRGVEEARRKIFEAIERAKKS
ncbi:MAG: inorganic diphosphatase [Acidilobaceae archaeon]